MRSLKIFLTVLTIAFTGLFSYGQTQSTLPAGSTSYSGNLFLDPDGNIWTGRTGSYTNLGSWEKVTEAMPDTWTPTQIDSAIMSNIATLSSKASNFIITSNTSLDWQSDLAFDEMGNSTSETWAQRYGNSINILRLYNDGGTWRDQSSQVSVLFSGQDIQTVTFGSVIGQNRITITGKGSGAPIGIFTNRGDWVAGTYSRGDYVTAPARGDPSAVSIYFLIGTEEYNSTTSPTTDTANWSEVPAPGGFQTLSQPAIGQIAISDGNTVALNTVNTSGNQTGIAGNKTWTGVHNYNFPVFYNGNIFRNGGAGTSRTLLFQTDNVIRWGFGANTSAESGGNAGSNFSISSYNDNGSFLRTDLTISRNNGAWTLPILSDTGDGIVGVTPGGQFTRRPESDLIQTLSLGTGAGEIAISGGNSVNLTSLGAINLSDANDMSLPIGVHAISYSGGDNFPSVSGGGIRVKQNNTGSQGYFDIISDRLSLGKLLYRRAISAASGTFHPWQTFASEEWANDQGWLKSADIGDGTLSLATGTGLTGSASFSANQSTPSTFTVEAASGYAIPTTAKQTEWDTAYGWGNHATEGYLKSVVGSDLGLAANNVIPVWSGTAWISNGRSISEAAAATTVVIRNSGGRGRFNDAVNNDEAVTLGQADSRYLQPYTVKTPTISFTLGAANKNDYIIASANITITMPAGLSETDYPIGSTTNVRVSAGASVSFAGASGVTLDHPDGTGNVSVEGRKVVSIVRVGTNAYDLIY